MTPNTPRRSAPTSIPARRGITLVEIMVVVAVIAALVGILLLATSTGALPFIYTLF